GARDRAPSRGGAVGADDGRGGGRGAGLRFGVKPGDKNRPASKTEPPPRRDLDQDRDRGGRGDDHGGTSTGTGRRGQIGADLPAKRTSAGRAPTRDQAPPSSGQGLHPHRPRKCAAHPQTTEPGLGHGRLPSSPRHRYSRPPASTAAISLRAN